MYLVDIHYSRDISLKGYLLMDEVSFTFFMNGVEKRFSEISEPKFERCVNAWTAFVDKYEAIFHKEFVFATEEEIRHAERLGEDLSFLKQRTFDSFSRVYTTENVCYKANGFLVAFDDLADFQRNISWTTISDEDAQTIKYNLFRGGDYWGQTEIISNFNDPGAQKVTKISRRPARILAASPVPLPDWFTVEDNTQ